MESFRPTNWSNSEIHDYVTTYMHNDDVLPILSQPEYIAFRNSDLFSGICLQCRLRDFYRCQYPASS